VKHEKKRGGLIRRIWSLLAHNWSLKLLALVLAILVYHSLKPHGGLLRKPNDRSIFQQQ
jgi:hypothetical protein